MSILQWSLHVYSTVILTCLFYSDPYMSILQWSLHVYSTMDVTPKQVCFIDEISFYNHCMVLNYMQ